MRHSGFTAPGLALARLRHKKHGGKVTAKALEAYVKAKTGYFTPATKLVWELKKKGGYNITAVRDGVRVKHYILNDTAIAA